MERVDHVDEELGASCWPPPANCEHRCAIASLSGRVGPTWPPPPAAAAAAVLRAARREVERSKTERFGSFGESWKSGAVRRSRTNGRRPSTAESTALM